MSEPEPDDIPIEQALEMIAQRLGMLTTSVDGVAEGQQDMLVLRDNQDENRATI